MTLEECKDSFPIGQTFIGTFTQDGTIASYSFDEVENIEKWNYSPLYEADYVIPFVYYNKKRNTLECWYFGYEEVSGYLTEDGEDFQPMVYSEDFGWENIGETEIIITDRNMLVEAVLDRLDSEAHTLGYLFTDAEALKEFVRGLISAEK